MSSSTRSPGPVFNSVATWAIGPWHVSMRAADWDFLNSHVVTLEVVASDIDAYDHVDNAVYLSWFDQVAWSHSAALGVTLEECVRIRRGMAAHRTEIDYQRAAVQGDRVSVATWIVSTDHRLRVE